MNCAPTILLPIFQVDTLHRAPTLPPCLFFGLQLFYKIFRYIKVSFTYFLYQ